MTRTAHFPRVILGSTVLFADTSRAPYWHLIFPPLYFYFFTLVAKGSPFSTSVVAQFGIWLNYLSNICKTYFTFCLFTVMTQWRSDNTNLFGKTAKHCSNWTSIIKRTQLYLSEHRDTYTSFFVTSNVNMVIRWDLPYEWHRFVTQGEKAPFGTFILWPRACQFIGDPRGTPLSIYYLRLTFHLFGVHWMARHSVPLGVILLMLR